mmetsp:Transcript_6606/g.15110  ORF Transcript_6606/g.15110 Transcript_6606/m.15110 type:complete len:534 (-) Transcript_6606:147-1748(-)
MMLHTVANIPVNVFSKPVEEKSLVLDRDLKVQKSIKEQLRRDRACLSCKKSKVKCDGERPCRSCILKGKCDLCVDQDMTNAESDMKRPKNPNMYTRKALKRDQACMRCNKSKVKCDGNRPCSRCVARGCQHDCLNISEYNNLISTRNSPISDTSNEDSLAQLWNPPDLPVTGSWTPNDSWSWDASNEYILRGDNFLVPIDRPIAFPAQCLAHSRSFDYFTADDVPFLLRTFWENQGVSFSGIRNIYSVLPLRLKETLSKSLTALERLLNVRAKNPFGMAMQSRVLKSWQQSARCGYQAITLDPSTNRWATCAVNEWLSEFAGVHREEMLARMANQDMQLPSTELRQFCAHLSGLLELSQLIFDPFYLKNGEKRYWVSRWNKNFAKDPCPEGVLMRACLTVHTDEHGYLCGITRTQVVISEEEYDMALRSDPSACEALAVAVVGMKSGKELIRRELIQEESMLNMVSTDKGRNQLNKLCDILESRFQPIVERAEAEGLMPYPALFVADSGHSANNSGWFHTSCEAESFHGFQQA